MSNSDVTFIIPCLNEADSIGLVISELRSQFPDSNYIVCDNNSVDQTSSVAASAGAKVCFESRKGKGYAVRKLISQAKTNIIIMIDGDYTYDPSKLFEAVAKFRRDNYDVASGSRLEDSSGHTRPGHYLGNLLFNYLASFLLGKKQYDIFSGFFIFSYEFLFSFPQISTQFEIEAELATHIARMDSKYFSFPTKLRPRLYGESKLSTFKDGFRILNILFKNSFTEFPERILFPASIISFIFAIILFAPVIIEYAKTGLVTLFPRLVVACCFIILSSMIFFSSLILRMLIRIRIENRLFVQKSLSIPNPMQVHPFS